MKYKIGIGISAGIAGYKIADLIKSLKAKNIAVSVIMTKKAVEMFGSDIFSASSGNKVYQKIIPDFFDYQAVLKLKKVEHITLADSLDLLLVAPATADIIAKIAHGIADDFLTTLVLSVTCKVVIAPSMNSNMWTNKITRENLLKLKSLGFLLISPDSGQLACGYQGVGRLKNINEIENIILHYLQKSSSLKGKKILVTGGGTSEPIDDVRYITNKASGKMGKSIAECAYLRGGKTLFIKADSALGSDFPVKEASFNTVSDLKAQLLKYCPDYDIIFHSASVSDFRLYPKFSGKLDSQQSLHLDLHPAEKLINQIKNINPKIKLVGFKAEFGIKEYEIKNISAKLFKEAKADYVVVNDISRDDIGFSSDYNELYIISKKGLINKLQKDTKQQIADKLLDIIL